MQRSINKSIESLILDMGFELIACGTSVNIKFIVFFHSLIGTLTYGVISYVESFTLIVS